MNPDLSIPVIGRVQSPFHEKFGIPRQPNLVQVPAIIEFNAPYDDAMAFEGLEAFSHIWLIWVFNQNKHSAQKQPKFRTQIRPPRLGGNQKTGIFASRSMYRPSPLGLSVVQLVKVIRQNASVKLLVRGADLLNGTPIVDIKPYIAYSDAIPHAVSGFAQQAPARFQVEWTAQASRQAAQLVAQNRLNPEQQQLIHELLALDPRPAYQDDENRIYGMAYDQVNVSFRIFEAKVSVEAITQLHL
ncbi:tRNA (N6-threonylcarbamoyladenosine(37)-N6)-methyltransferase TrmO [Alkanindiges sp. WGS2144]|uniref:tRNA (N6-threonylcarbamoyladenosine(37)-N6)-methyltransferase TrmO n=1 Tax=Alkanindiges sp. WGS2144 TaxID=3366808 RepID=UPI00375061E6